MLALQMEKEMSKQFDNGLTSIKTIVESDKKADGPKVEQPNADQPKLELPKIAALKPSA